MRRGHGERNKLAKIRATPGSSPVTLGETERQALLTPLLTQWSPQGDWIL
jgi:hypothetical protein